MLERLAGLKVPHDLIEYRDTESLRDWLYSRRGIEVARIGWSREDEELFGYRFGHGPRKVSIIAGCHADEPVGPITAQLLPEIVRTEFPELLDTWRFHVVPQMNPDGAERNRNWFQDPLELDAYLANVLRERPGDDIEFGFATTPGARPEPLAAMQFLRPHAPFDAHFTLHGMGFAEGAWCLLSPEWTERAEPFMDRFSLLCERREFPMHDVDRGGEKGFSRIRYGFSTHPNSSAMKAFFRERNEPDIASRFRPSSMEWIRAQGGDPLCIVSELPLFLVGRRSESLEEPIPPELKTSIAELSPPGSPERDDAIEALADTFQISAVPLDTQVALQIGMIVLALERVVEVVPESEPDSEVD